MNAMEAVYKINNDFNNLLALNKLLDEPDAKYAITRLIASHHRIYQSYISNTLSREHIYDSYVRSKYLAEVLDINSYFDTMKDLIKVKLLSKEFATHAASAISEKFPVEDVALLDECTALAYVRCAKLIGLLCVEALNGTATDLRLWEIYCESKDYCYDTSSKVRVEFKSIVSKIIDEFVNKK